MISRAGSASTRDPAPLRALAVPLMVLVGAGVAVQSQINGELASRLGGGTTGGLTAAVVSFGSGLLVVSAVTLARSGARRRLAAVRSALGDGRLRWWHLAGGSAGAALVASQGLSVGVIGVGLFTVGVVAGQAVSGLAVDRAGVAPGAPRPVTTRRVVGAAVTVVAVGAAVAERVDEPGAASWVTLLLVLLPFVAGAGTAWQQAVNGRVAVVGGPWAAAQVNFTVGTTVLVVAWVVTLAAGGQVPSPPGQWWLYLGGLVGVGFIASAAVLVRVHGVLVLALSTIAGNVLAAVVLDRLVGGGLLGAQGVVATAVTLLGAALAVSGGRRSAPSAGARTETSGRG